jgi:hypothetical protein
MRPPVDPIQRAFTVVALVSIVVALATIPLDGCSALALPLLWAAILLWLAAVVATVVKRRPAGDARRTLIVATVLGGPVLFAGCNDFATGPQPQTIHFMEGKPDEMVYSPLALSQELARFPLTDAEVECVIGTAGDDRSVANLGAVAERCGVSTDSYTFCFVPFDD